MPHFRYGPLLYLAVYRASLETMEGCNLASHDETISSCIDSSKGRLNSVQEAIRRCAFDEAVKGLAYILRTMDEYAIYDLSQDKMYLESFRLHVLSLKGLGKTREALIIFETLLSAIPDQPQIALEVIVIQVMDFGDYRSAIEFISSISEEIRKSDSIRLFEALCYSELKDYSRCIAVLEQMMPRAGWWPFEGVWEQLRQGIMDHLLVAQVAASQHFIRPGWALSEADKIIPWLAGGAISPVNADIRSFQSALEAITWSNDLGDHSATSLIEFLIRHAAELGRSEKVASLHHLLSLDRYDEVDRYFNSILYDIEALSCFPKFIKVIDLLAQRCENWHEVQSKSLRIFFSCEPFCNFNKGDYSAFAFTGFDDDVTIALEICSRHQYFSHNDDTHKIPKFSHYLPSTILPSAQRAHVFIGIFGQIRGLNDALPKVLNYLHQDMALLKKRGTTISYGISTWDKTGQKLVLSESPCAELSSRLPQPFMNYISDQKIASVSDFSDHFPAISKKVMQLSRSEVNVDVDNLNNIFEAAKIGRDGFYASIDSDEAFSNDIGEAIQSTLGDAGRGFMNQARMWHRIKRLKVLMQQAEHAAERPASSIVLVRPDVFITSGSLASILEHAQSVDTREVVYCDFDQHAHLIDGIGDRYFVGGRDAVSKAFEGIDIIREIIEDRELLNRFGNRLLWHRFPRSLFYCTSCDVSPLRDISYQFFRDNFLLEDLSEAIRLDANHAKLMIARQFAEKLMALKDDEDR